VNVAFHFNADAEKYGAWYGKPIEEMFFRISLNASRGDVHLKISRGDLLTWQYLGKAGPVEDISVLAGGLPEEDDVDEMLDEIYRARLATCDSLGPEGASRE
jgi:hypothetical protein